MHCTLCPHRCALQDGGAPGRCRVRALRAGVNLPRNYGRLTALALDPIEKKPLKRFMPGSTILSVGSFGCNMACYFCQNEHIATADLDTAYSQHVSPERLVDMALAQKPRGNIGVAFTYNEPLVGFEYVRDTALLLRQAGLKTVVVTNGCFHVEPMQTLFPLVDAWNIDLKGFSQGWYRKLGGNLEVVQAFIEEAHRFGHVELTTLVVPGENDSVEEMRALSRWVASLSPSIPLHISRFFPRHHALQTAPTPPQTIRQLCEVAQGALRHVYAGNL